MRILNILVAGLLSMGVNQLVFADSSSSLNQQIHDYLINNPEILIEMSQKLQQKQDQQAQDMQKKASQTIPSIAKGLLNPASPVGGNPKGDISVVEFFDYQCSHCKDMSPVLDGVVSKDKGVKVVYKEFPIFGGNSLFAAKAALAANMQGKYGPMHHELISSPNPLTEDKVMDAAKKAGVNVKQMKKDMDSDTVKNELNANLKLAQQLALLGTPAFVIVDSNNASQSGRASVFVPGATTSDVLVGLIDNVRKNVPTPNS